MSKKKYVTLKDFFYKYPYKKNKEGLSPNTIPSAYIKKEDISDHVWAIEFNQYTAFMDEYFKAFLQDIALGHQFNIPFVGSFKMVKRYNPRKINVLATIQANGGKWNKDNLTYWDDDYFYRVRWNRTAGKTSSYHKYLKVRPTRKGYKVIQNEIKKNPYLFNRWPDIRR